MHRGLGQDRGRNCERRGTRRPLPLSPDVQGPCRVALRLIPAGVAKLHLHSLPRRFLLTSNPRSLARAWWLVLADLVGTSPLYEYHMDSNDPACLPQFNPLGWSLFYRRAAELLCL